MWDQRPHLLVLKPLDAPGVPKSSSLRREAAGSLEGADVLDMMLHPTRPPAPGCALTFQLIGRVFVST